MVRPVIDYRGEHDFACTPDQLWDAIAHFERFEEWWPWLQELRLDGAQLGDGAVLRGVVAPPLPYRMRVQVELIRCRRPHSIEAEVRGDLAGPALLTLQPTVGGTRVEASWTVEMRQRPMRLASLVAHPLLRWGHDRVVDVTVARFRRYVASGT